MAEPFKNFINTDTIAAAARHLSRVDPSFDAAGFRQDAAHDLDALEFKARAMQIADAMDRYLPAEFARAADILEQALHPADVPLDAEGEPKSSLLPDPDAGMHGWVLWAVGDVVARRGLHHPERAFECLHAVTRRFTAEFAIRPLLAAHPDVGFAYLQRWVCDPSAHVRRLVSEGSRPRLPWGLRLQALVQDPRPSLPLLQILQDDPSSYVRRSVANHLNDIAKDHPQLVTQWLERYLPGASPQRAAALRHASRVLIKQGDTATLRAWGLTPGLSGTARAWVSAQRCRVGESVTVLVDLDGSQARTEQQLEIDLRVHFCKALGKTSAKVFKAWKLNLAAGERKTLSKQLSFRPVTTRSLYPGAHQIDIQVNGQILATTTVDLEV